MMPLIIDENDQITGSLVFEEFETFKIKLNFFSSALHHGDNDYELSYPQEPLTQTWIEEYPILAYKNFSPLND